MSEGRGPGDYQAGWQPAEVPAIYEEDLRREGWYGGWLQQREQELLFDVVDRHLGGRAVRHLDFACGTGRILAALRSRVTSALGVDTSAEMLAVAASKAPHAAFVCGDLTVDHELAEGRYELITAFRFFLNAEEQLRNDALAALTPLLTDDGIVVVNLHGNTWSLRGLSVLLRRHLLRQRWWNTMSYAAMRDLLSRHGLQVAEVHGYNYLSSKGYLLMSAASALALERLFSRLNPVRVVAANLMFVCQRTGTPVQPPTRR